MSQLAEMGFELVKGVIDQDEIDRLRKEVDRIGETCTRNLCAVSELICDFANRIGLKMAPETICVRSILFDKTAEMNWPVAWHQDLTIAVSRKVDIDGVGPWSIKQGVHSVQPPIEILAAMSTVRVHLDDTPESNGALCVIPYSHKLGKIHPKDFGELTVRSETCSCKSGDVLLMSPLLLHSSKRSLEPSRRRVLHFEFAPRNALPEPLSWVTVANSFK